MKFQKHRQYGIQKWATGSCVTWTAQIWVAGDIIQARQKLRELCFPKGLCATITPTEYMYAGGEELGFVIGMIQYPPFMESELSLLRKAERVGKALAENAMQWSFTIVTPTATFYYSRRRRTV